MVVVEVIQFNVEVEITNEEIVVAVSEKAIITAFVMAEISDVVAAAVVEEIEFPLANEIIIIIIIVATSMK